jgi:hypothetical protein
MSARDLQKRLVLSGRYIVHTRGGWRPDAIAHMNTAGARLHLSPEARRELRALVEEYKKTGRSLKVDATGALPLLYRLVSWKTGVPGQISIATGVTDYAEYLLTNIRHPDWRAAGLRLADPIGVCAATLTRDRELILGLRSTAVLDRPNTWHVVPGGHPNRRSRCWTGYLTSCSMKLE